MKKLVMRVLAIISVLVLMLTLTVFGEEEKKVYKIGICNYVDDASLNQIYANISAELKNIGDEKGVAFEIDYENCQADPNMLYQIVQNFNIKKVDLMVGIATPVALQMQALTTDNSTPVVFAAVSDPVGAKLVNTLEAPGSNVTGTSDYLDTESIINLIFATIPNAKRVGLLYDIGQDSSTAPIADAKRILEARGIEVVERTGTNTNEIITAANYLIADKVDAVFTPTDNTVMNAQYSIYEAFTKAGIPQFCGADSFALNGAFLGYGVDYANLGKETAEMVAEILIDGKSPAQVAVRTFDNGTATLNTETAKALGYDIDSLKEKLAPLCTRVEEITTKESFDEPEAVEETKSKLSFTDFLGLAKEALVPGLVVSLVVLALFLSYSMLGVCDLSTDGCFTLGAAVGAVVAVSGHPFLAVPAAIGAGMFSGLVTSLLQTRLGVDSLLAGIVVNTGLYSINLLIMSKPIVALTGVTTLFTMFKGLFAGTVFEGWYSIILALLFVIVIILFLSLFLRTRLGLAIRATGNNPDMVSSSSTNPKTMTVIGLIVSGGITALSGCLLGEVQNSANIDIGSGMVTIALASLLIGNSFTSKRKVAVRAIGAVIGSYIFQLVYTIALSLNIDSFMFKLVSAVIIVIAISGPYLKKHYPEILRRISHKRKAGDR